MSLSIIAAMVAISWPFWCVTMVLMTGYCNSASCMSTATSTFSRRIISMNAYAVFSVSVPFGRPGHARFKLRTST